jgi:heat shock protein HtpX
VNLLEQQAANRRRTWLVMAVFIGFLAFIGAGFDVLILGQGGVYIPVGTILALVVGFGSAWVTMRTGDRMVLASASAVPIGQRITEAASDDDRLRYTQFQNIVDEMAIAAGVPSPKAYIVPDVDPNAFATGRDPDHASIAVTEGLLRSLDREELQGVVAHEMGHVRNLDIRLMMIVAALVGGVVLLADWSGRIMRFGIGGGSRSRKGKNAAPLMAVFFVIWIISIVVAPLVARLLALWVSRTREYQADASGAELTRNPGGLASALKKIEGAAAPTEAIKRGSALLCIADPMGLAVNQKESALANLWATHPPMAKRIAVLEAMAYQRT